MTILIDTTYIGKQIYAARKALSIKKQDAAKLFGITTYQLRRLERGKTVIPEHILAQLFDAGLSFMAYQHRNNNRRAFGKN